jgi:beta-lactamase regulating signal transducer with metallopeptidase domain
MTTSWLENLLSQGTTERLGWVLVHFLWQAAVVALLLAAFLRLLRRSGANVRYLTACAALAMMVVLPVATIYLIEVAGPAAEVGPGPEFAATTAPLPPGNVVQASDKVFTPSDVPLETADATIPISWNERIASVLRPALPYAVLGWLIGVFGLSAWHLGGWMQLQGLKRRMVHHVGATLQQRLAEIAGRLGVRRAVTLLESAIVEVPTVVGWLRPVVLLPASALTGLNPEQLEAILAHELAHIRRCDYLVNVLQTAVEILGFYHPAVWWVSRRIRIERENCCDDMAVRVCGDSVRYARALTCLEEIRHNQAKLALAATGGSLLDRIARLLGRPASDDRRFAWLPGLIALLLIIGVIIPTALTLGESTADRSEPPSANVAASMHEESQDAAQTNEPNRAQVLLDFVIAEAFSDAILDQDTAAKVVDLLARIPVGNAGRTVVSDASPSIEELQEPLVDVFAKFAPRPGKSRNLVDRLVSTGYAQVICAPRLQMSAGQQASIATGDTPDPNATQSENREFELMRLNVTANEVQDQNATRLEIDLVRTYPAYGPGDPNKETTASTIHLTLVAPNDQYTPITHLMMKRVDENGRERFVLAFVQPAIVRSPDASPLGKVNESSASDPNVPQVGLRTEVAGEPNAAEADTAYVQVDVKILKAVDSSELDRETVLQIEKILGKRVRPEGRAGEFGPRLHLTTGEVLRDHVVQQMLPGETMDALLQLLGSSGRHLEVLSSPRVVARDGMKCQVKMVTDEYIYTAPPANGSSEPGKLEKIEAGTTVDLTPHIGDHNEVTMEIMVEMTDLVRPSSDAGVPVVSMRSVRATVTMLTGLYITLGGMVEGGTSAPGQDGESVYIMAIPTIVKPPDANQAPTNDSGRSDSADRTGQRGESTIEVRTRAMADAISPKRWIGERTAYVNSDPMYQELIRRRVEIWGELTAKRQKLAPDHPEIIQKQALLDAFKKQMDERKRSLEQEFEDHRAEWSAAPEHNQARVRVEFLMADVLFDGRLDDQTAAEAADLLAGAIPNITAKDLRRPLGQILQQCAEPRILSDLPVEAFMNLLAARGHVRRLTSPTLLLPEGNRGQIEVGDSLDSPDDTSRLSLIFTVTPESDEKMDAILLDVRLDGRRQEAAEPGKGSPRRIAGPTDAGVLAKSDQYVGMPRISAITWYDKQGNERILFTAVKPIFIKSGTGPAAPANGDRGTKPVVPAMSRDPVR